MLIVTILICFFIFILSLICSKDNIFSPGVITSGLWLIVLLLFGFVKHDLNPLTAKFLTPISIWVSFFCLSSLLIQSLRFKKQRIVETSQLTRNIFYYASLFTFPLLIYNAYQIIQMGSIENWMGQLRMAAIGGLKNVDMEATSPFYVIIWFVSYLIELINFNKTNRNRVYVLFIMYFTYSFITMAKINFLFLFIGTIYILHSKNLIKFKSIIISGIILIVIFLSIQSLRSKTSTTKEKNTAQKMITLYLLSPSPAFETIVPNSSVRFGENTFRIFYAMAYKLGLSDKKPVDTLLGYVDVGVGTNTYTTLYPFYKDFGLFGIALFAIFIGLIMGYIYNKTESGNYIYIVIYAFFITQIVMQYAAEMFFTTLTLNLKRIIIVLIPFIIIKYNLFSKYNIFNNDYRIKK